MSGIREGLEAEVVRIAQEAANLGEAERAAIEPAARAFLEAYKTGEWSRAHASLHPALRDSVGLDEIEAGLQQLRDSLGALRAFELASVARRSSGARELEYVLSCDHGPGIARFEMAADDGALLLAYLVLPKPGTPLHAENLRGTVSRLLAGAAGSPIEALDAPLDRLARPGDAVHLARREERGARE